MGHQQTLAWQGVEMRPHDALPRGMEIGSWLVEQEDSVGTTHEGLSDDQRLFDSGSGKAEWSSLDRSGIGSAGEHLDLDGLLRRLFTYLSLFGAHLKAVAGGQFFEQALDVPVARLGELVTVLEREQSGGQGRIASRSRATDDTEIPQGAVQNPREDGCQTVGAAVRSEGIACLCPDPLKLVHRSTAPPAMTTAASPRDPCL